MSEQTAVMEYLWERILKAWKVSDMEEAQAAERFYRHLEGLNDVQYNEQYAEPVA